MQYVCTVRKAAIFLIAEKEDTANQWQTFILEAQTKKKHSTRGNFLTSHTIHNPPTSLWWCYHSCAFLYKAIEKSYNLSRRLQDLCCMHIQAGASENMPLMPTAATSTAAHTQHLPSDASARSKDRSTSATDAGRVLHEGGQCLPRTNIYWCHLA